jgi:TRAP-type C4-dicarboxylate transport system permease small subunit
MTYCDRIQEDGVLLKLYGTLQKVIRTALCVLLVCMVVIVFANVISRYYLEASLAWSEEVTRFMLIWMVFLGAVLAYVNDEHLGLDIVVKNLPHRLRSAIAVLVDLLIMFAVWLLIQGGLMLTVGSWEWEAPATAIPYGAVYTIVPVCGSLLLLQALGKMVAHARGLFARGEHR